jgi:hypothetical protein
MRGRIGTGVGGRILLALLTLYGIAIIAPDIYRIAHPLGSFGLNSNGDGLIYDVQGPFIAEAESPAWEAGIRSGDRLDLAGMRCIPVNTDLCASMLALWGGLNYVLPGRKATLLLAATGDRPARPVTLVAQPRPRGLVLDFVLLLDQIAGTMFVLGAAWLVWIRPGPMTWGFFAYAIQFNPGQAFQFYAWLQQWPVALLIQEVVDFLMQAAGYTGLLLFALRVPDDRADGGWRRVERALPVFTALFLIVALASLGSAFGHRTETMMRDLLFIGFGIDAAALGILLGRRKGLAPRDYQRIRWVIWGCLIGLPAFLIAELSQMTSLPSSLLGGVPISEDVCGLLFLINGIVCLFVVEAVRRPTIVNVSIPLRRATMLGLLLSMPALFLHRQLETIDELIHMPGWAWLLVASTLAFLISRLHEFATDLADRLFDRDFRRAEAHFAAIRRRVEHADSLDEIERLLVDEPLRWIHLASAAVFREHDGAFRRHASAGWGAKDVDRIDGTDGLLAGRFGGALYSLDPDGSADVQLPDGLARPLLGVPIGNPRRCFAVALYGSHETGTDLSRNERDLLAGLAREAAIAYAQVDSEMLSSRIAALEKELSRVSAAAVGAPG